MRLAQIFRRINIKKPKNIWIWIVVFLITIVILCSLALQFISIKDDAIGSRADLLRKYPILPKLLPIYWKLRKTSDIIYWSYYFEKDELPTYELYISQKNLEKLNKSLPEGFMGVSYEEKIYVPAEFKYDNKTYKVEVRHRGINAVHWNAPKKSYLIKFDKDNIFNGIRKLSFMIPDDRCFVLEHFNNYRAGKMGLMPPPSGFSNLKINGKNNGLYFTIENWSKEMLVKWEVPDESNFYGDGGLLVVEGIVKDYNSWDNLDSWQLQASDKQFNYQHFSEINKLLQLLNNSNDKEFYDAIFNLVDKDNFYSWKIHQSLINSSHQTSGNLRLYFNNSSGKLYFIPWDVETGGLYSDHMENMDFFDLLSRRVFSNPMYLYEKNKRLYDYVSNKDNLEDDLSFYDKTFKDIKTSLYKDRMKIYTNLWVDKFVNRYREDIIYNFNKLKDAFKDNLIFIDVGVINDDEKRFQDDYLLAYFDMQVKGISGLFLENFDIEFNDNLRLTNYKLYYDANFNNQLDSNDKLVKDYKDFLLYTNRVLDPNTELHNLKLTKHRFYLTSRDMSSTDFSRNLTSFEFDVENAITGKKIKKKNISIKIVNEGIFKYFSYISDIAKFRRENPFFKVDDRSKEIILPAGTYNINKTIIVPKGFTLKISPGTTLRLAPDVSLVSYSNIIASGTRQKPIVIIGQYDDKPWGVFAVLNNEKESIFDYCKISGGRDDYINGVYLSGMLSVYHSDVLIRNSEFYNAQADDAINIKTAKAEIINNKFINNKADAIDLDFVKEGKIDNNEFYNNGNDSIDLSGSSLIVKNNYIENSGDKCISIGEKTIDAIFYNNVLNSCNIGIEIKDLSDVKIINNVVVNNDIGINAYQKKPVFGGGQASIYNSIIWDNKADVQTDKQSNILVYNSNIKDSQKENSNFNLVPIFSNPKARDFTISPSSDKVFIEGGNKDILESELDIILDKAPVGLNK